MGARPVVRLSPTVALVRSAVTFEHLEGFQVSSRTPEQHRKASATLVQWAAAPHPDDEETPTDLLSAAAWHLEEAGDIEAALEMHRRAIAAEGTTTPDARCLLHAALLTAGRLDEARTVAEELRRSRPSISDLAAMAENFEIAGDLTQAHRWVAMGVARLDLADDETMDHEVEMLLATRRRIRSALGYPPDELYA